MTELEKVINGLECKLNPNYDTCKDCQYYGEEFAEDYPDFQYFCNRSQIEADALELLKAQAQEISRLKHHVDCDAAEKIPSGCVGYGRGFNDDEPCETCKQCPAYNGYGEE